MCCSEGFTKIKGMGQFAKKIVELNNDIMYPLVYLATLSLILPQL